jgi:hypothetical protein
MNAWDDDRALASALADAWPHLTHGQSTLLLTALNRLDGDVILAVCVESGVPQDVTRALVALGSTC